jgi:putative ABC transport system permease protein
MILNWIKVFLYQLKQNKLFSLLNTLGLAIGISGIIFAILFWNEEHSYNRWNPDSGRIFQVVNVVGKDMTWPYTQADIGAMIKASSSEVQDYCYSYTEYRKDVFAYKGKKKLVEKIVDAQSNFFSFFPFEFIHGNPATALQGKNSIAISENTARQLFGDENPMGKQLVQYGELLVVQGVYRLKGKSSVAPDAVMTGQVEKDIAGNKGQWGNFNFSLLLKLEHAENARIISKEIERIYYENRTLKWAKNDGLTPEEYVKKNGQITVFLENLKTARLFSAIDGYPEGKGNYKFLLIMAGLSVLILILSVMNYINLATASAIKRAKEVGVRKIMGAGKSNIVFQFLMETVFITTFAILLALAIVELGLPFYNDFLDKDLVMVGSQFYMYLLLIFVCVIFLAGIFPAVYVSNFETLKVLKGNFGRSKSGIWIRNGMLILQFAIASFFITGSYIVYRQVTYMSTKDMGFSGKQIVQVAYRNTGDWRAKDYKNRLISRYNMVKQEILKMKGVAAVSGTGFSFDKGATSSSSFVYNGHTIQGQNMTVDFGTIEMMKIKVKSGRPFSEKFASDTISSILVNETALRMMGEKNPIGKEIKWNEHRLRIIGVVADFNFRGPQNEIPPMVFFHYKTIDWMLNNVHQIYVKADAATMARTISQLEKFWNRKVDTEYPFTYDFVDKAFARTYETYVKQKNLFSLLNIVVVLIALFGLFALASFSIERRMKEIAIRKTLGAETASLLRELSKQYFVFCFFGFVIAFLPTRIILSKWLEDFPYRLEITVIPFIIGFVALSVLTLAIVNLKAYRATRIDVLHYLKYE